MVAVSGKLKELTFKKDELSDIKHAADIYGLSETKFAETAVLEKTHKALERESKNEIKKKIVNKIKRCVPRGIKNKSLKVLHDLRTERNIGLSER
ncbi:MAG: hypothetical protein HRT90_08795 [Candidatus Margulisbacteria bacterium]|nr:hypothetical protein [Candidatus Margulisiibacteriota bacterium]